MQNLPEVSLLFAGPSADDLVPQLDGEFDEGHGHNIDDADFALNEDVNRSYMRCRYRDTKYTFYPHFYSKTIGQWQADGIINPLVPYVKQVTQRLTVPGAAGRALVPLGSQAYNSSMHCVRVSKRFHIVQKGILSAAAAGPWASTAKSRQTASALFGKVNTAFPHERVTAQLQGLNGKWNSLRLENNFLLDFNHLREEYCNGDSVYRKVVIALAQICERPAVVDAIRRTSVLFKYECFPDIYSWATLPVTALIEAVWNHHIKPIIRANDLPEPLRGPLRKPKAHYVELLASLERLLNYGYTGAARVLPTQLMRDIWAGRSILQTGFPMLWVGLFFAGDNGCVPMVKLKLWPLDQETKG
ncbi:hypothetical protein BD414DRAFT_534865 [Trametes punicea]|nr:hypothetical protein BD414DRAFT_534865 [Trametes punicea]